MSESLKRAEEKYVKGQIHEAMDLLAQIKSTDTQVEGVDFLRAKCFIKMGEGNEATAREALKEELRLHPSNTEALSLYESLFREVNLSAYAHSPEFQEIVSELSFHSMMPMRHLLNLFEKAKDVLQKNVPGNFVECGVAAGGSSALLGALIGKYDCNNRHCYSFDTFCGMPDPSYKDQINGKDAQSTYWGKGTCAAPLESLHEACRKVEAESYVSPIQGLFQKTLPENRDKIGKIAFLHIDCDWYESTVCVLENLFPLLSSGAKVIIDDYDYWDGVQKAYSEYCTSYGLNYPIVKLTPTTALVEVT